MDTTSIADGVAALKTGLDMARGALRLVKDVQEILPAGEQKEAIGQSLANAERQMKIAGAQIAVALGFRLCQCEFPPTPMVLAGVWVTAWGDPVNVRECPVCKSNDADRYAWERTVGLNAGEQIPGRKDASRARRPRYQRI